jgi:hypothetical protein
VERDGEKGRPYTYPFGVVWRGGGHEERMTVVDRSSCRIGRRARAAQEWKTSREEPNVLKDT